MNHTCFSHPPQPPGGPRHGRRRYLSVSKNADTVYVRHANSLVKQPGMSGEIAASKQTKRGDSTVKMAG